MDFGAVSKGGTVNGSVGVCQQRGDRRVLTDLDPECAGGSGERHAGAVGLAPAPARFVGEGGKILEMGAGPQLGHRVVPEKLDRDTDVLLHRHIGLQRCDVVVTDTDHIAALAEADVVTEQLRCAFEDLNAVPRHRRQRGIAVVASDDGAGLAGHP